MGEIMMRLAMLCEPSLIGENSIGEVMALPGFCQSRSLYAISGFDTSL
jgi:hypothetical protein